MVWRWSKTAASNANSDSMINWAEGMPPSAVNDSARAEMARVAQWRDDISGALVTAGTSTAYTVSSNQVFDTLAHMDGAMVTISPHVVCGSPVQLNVDSLGLKPLRLGPGIEIPAGMLLLGGSYPSRYNNTDGAFYLHAAYAGAGVVSYAASHTVLAAEGGKLIKVTATATITTPDATVVGPNFFFALSNLAAVNITLAGSGGTQTIDGAAAGVNVTIPPGNGAIVYTDGANWFTAGQNFTTSFPPVGSFKNLVIKVASNTTVTASADYITVGNGAGKFQTLAFSGTINLGTTGANALDTGTIAIDQWYAIHAIAKSDGTTAWLASLSATSPTMPSGYTYAGRVGWVQTIHASATLYGTWQFGRRGGYVVGLAQTANLPNMVFGTAGNVSTPTWTAVPWARFVPPTASVLFATLLGQSTGSAAMVAPNNSYGNATSTSNPSPVVINNATNQLNQSFSMMLESANVYYASGGISDGLNCVGWEDNI